MKNLVKILLFFMAPTFLVFNTSFAKESEPYFCEVECHVQMGRACQPIGGGMCAVPIPELLRHGHKFMFSVTATSWEEGEETFPTYENTCRALAKQLAEKYPSMGYKDFVKSEIRMRFTQYKDRVPIFCQSISEKIRYKNNSM